ncbi:MAG: citrate lyase subunit alpha, partial [Cetobacterium sp.]|nr:citrate lyase subunit alpha [Cetobacterium sp.]
MKNILGRDVPDYIEGYGEVRQYKGALSEKEGAIKKNFTFKRVLPGDCKLYRDIEKLMDKLPLK